jgi:murein L,D-transpeptidase YafK
MKKLTWLRLAVAGLLGYIAVLGVAAAWAKTAVSHRACPPGETVVLVDTQSGVLCLCRQGREERTFRVAVGRGGVDKRQEGDGRTPLGRYGLSPAQPSGRYHLFLPVAYPTVEQAKQGYSGSAIGVHGPHLAFAWLGHATVWSDWTLGCVAVATWSEIQAIAEWVANTKASEIVLV